MLSREVGIEVSRLQVCGVWKRSSVTHGREVLEDLNLLVLYLCVVVFALLFSLLGFGFGFCKQGDLFTRLKR